MASSLSNFNNGFLCSIFPCKQYGNSLAGENVYDWTNRKTLSQPGCAVSGDGTFIQSADALTQSSVYSTHKNLAVRKIMQAYAKKKTVHKIMEANAKKKTGLGLKTSQTKHDANDHGTHASMWKESADRLRTFYFAESERCFWNASFVSVFLFRWHAFPNFCTQIPRPLFSKASATAVQYHKVDCTVSH